MSPFTDEPDDADALNFLAICAHGRGEADAALELLGRAQAEHPADTTTLTNLGVLHRERGRLEEAQAALAEAVRIAPRSYVARLRLGEVLEARGRLGQALPAYFGAINHAQELGLWLSDATTDAPLRPLVKHAMRAVAAGRRMLFAALLTPLRERHGDAALARVGRGLAIYLGELAPDFPDPRQRPKFFYVPDLPPTPVFARELFPWYEALEAQTEVIGEEMRAVYAADGGFEPFLQVPGKRLVVDDHVGFARQQQAERVQIGRTHGRDVVDDSHLCVQVARHVFVDLDARVQQVGVRLGEREAHPGAPAGETDQACGDQGPRLPLPERTTDDYLMRP